MLAPAVEAAVQSALANQQYDRIAAILDAAELEVILALRSCAFTKRLRSCLMLCMCTHCVPCVCVLQSSNPNVLQEWPHAIHVLGLIYNQQL
jgi:hypothetical protein